MDSIGPGAQLLGLLEPSPSRLVLVAPFIKLGALKRVLDSIDPSSVQVDCVTRWLPTDIADGVCDLEILDALTALPTATLWLRDDLHAKYYRADDRCLVGSASHLCVIREVMDATTQGVPDSGGIKIIQPYNDPEEGIEAEDAWGILKEWIMHFFPGDFRRETGEEVLVRGRTF